MRVRVAHVNVRRTSGLRPFFEQAVDRHLAFAFGTGHFYKDLPELADERGYALWVSKSDEDEYDNLWIIVREDLLTESDWIDDEQNFLFETSVGGLGDICLGKGHENLDENDKALHFFLENDKSLQFYSSEGRVKLGYALPTKESVNFDYTEALYNVKPLSD